MKAVLMSIRPEWVQRILSGKKTLEIRKSHPRIETPFKVYIYCSEKGTNDPHKYLELHRDDGKIVPLNGFVVGEFTCKNVERFSVPFPAYCYEMDDEILKRSCLDYNSLHTYARHNALYGWDISDLEVYYCPKEISDFMADRMTTTDCYQLEALKRPPQSWCYVEEAEP